MGMVAHFYNDGALAEKMKSIRIHGSGKDKYDNIRIGINGRLDTFQAAILLEKLNIFPEEVKKEIKKQRSIQKIYLAHTLNLSFLKIIHHLGLNTLY